ncbi:hypothetical protein J2741_000878 [Methanolinea mesophila]|uniref:hypothetical protein n=1 Tax=Methanolinea mesophila TaxID=547055 RepID=UPI001AE343DD|nr:hypothetical protein [Methanolinea mesophila]MBP1928331.1 hypothetical protein [Methanolinea mesophila]
MSESGGSDDGVVEEGVISRSCDPSVTGDADRVTGMEVSDVTGSVSSWAGVVFGSGMEGKSAPGIDPGGVSERVSPRETPPIDNSSSNAMKQTRQFLIPLVSLPIRINRVLSPITKKSWMKEVLRRIFGVWSSLLSRSAGILPDFVIPPPFVSPQSSSLPWTPGVPWVSSAIRFKQTRSP